MTDPMLVGDVVLHDDEYTAHVTLLLGSAGGSFQTAFSTVATSHRAGFIPFIVCAQPRVPVWPRTIFVNKNPYDNDAHGELFWGPAHLGVAQGLQEGVERGLLTEAQAKDHLCIAAAWVWETATDRDRICRQNSQATLQALEQAMTGAPGLAAVREAVATEGYHNLFHRIEPEPAAARGIT